MEIVRRGVSRKEIMGTTKENEEQRKSTGLITERDLEILRWINRHGFAGVREVILSFQMNRAKAYSRIKVLTTKGLLRYERQLHSLPGVYWLTSEGARICNSPLNPLREPVLSTFEHDLAVVDLSIQIEKQYQGVRWITSREIISERLKGIKKQTEALKRMSRRVPDGVMRREGKSYAVELELTLKPEARLKNIINYYASEITAGNYAAVIYFCGSEVVKSHVIKIMSVTPVAKQFQVFIYKRSGG